MSAQQDKLPLGQGRGKKPPPTTEEILNIDRPRRFTCAPGVSLPDLDQEEFLALSTEDMVDYVEVLLAGKYDPEERRKEKLTEAYRNRPVIRGHSVLTRNKRRKRLRLS